MSSCKPDPSQDPRHPHYARAQAEAEWIREDQMAAYQARVEQITGQDQDEPTGDPMQPIHDLADGFLKRKVRLAQQWAPNDDLINLDTVIGPPADNGIAHPSEWIAALDQLLYYQPQLLGYAARLSMEDAKARIEDLLADLREHKELTCAAIRGGYMHLDD